MAVRRTSRDDLIRFEDIENSCKKSGHREKLVEMSRTSWNLTGWLLTDWGGPRRRRAARGDETAISRLSPAEPNGKLPKSHHRTAQHNAGAHTNCVGV